MLHEDACYHDNPFFPLSNEALFAWRNAQANRRKLDDQATVAGHEKVQAFVSITYMRTKSAIRFLFYINEAWPAVAFGGNYQPKNSRH